MNEEVILRMGLDASAVKRGTASVLEQQKKAANDTAAAWERAQARIIAAENKTARSMREAHEQTKRQINAEIELRKKAFRQGLEEQRKASGARGATSNARGVSVDSLGRSVSGRMAGAASGHLRGMNSGAVGEISVLARELASGNAGGFARSLSVLAQRMGWLSKAASMAINPITGVIAGLGVGAAVVHRIGQQARSTINGARGIGFSTAGFQGLQSQSSVLGENEAAMQGAGHLSGMVGRAKLGDTGTVRRFDQLGINLAGKSNEEIYAAALDKVASTADPVRKAALSLELFGQNIEKLQRTIDEGGEGFLKSREGMTKAGDLAVLSNTGDSTVGSFMRGTKSLLRGTGRFFQQGYAAYSKAVNSGSADLANATDEGVRIDEKIRAFQKAGLIKTHTVNEPGYRRKLAMENPELDIQLTDAQRSQREAQAAIDDRGKLGVSDMAGMARQMTGHIRPRIYSVTKRMRTAMKIDDLEAQATNAFLQDDDEKMNRLRNEADELRKANPWLKYQDRNPTERMEDELKKVTKTLEVVEKAANMIINPVL